MEQSGLDPSGDSPWARQEFKSKLTHGLSSGIPIRYFCGKIRWFLFSKQSIQCWLRLEQKVSSDGSVYRSDSQKKTKKIDMKSEIFYQFLSFKVKSKGNDNKEVLQNRKEPSLILRCKWSGSFSSILLKIRSQKDGWLGHKEIVMAEKQNL